MTRRVLCAWSLVVGASACETNGDATSDAGPVDATSPPPADAAAPDAADADPCPVVRLRGRTFVLRECPATARLALAEMETSPPYAYLEVLGEGPGEPLRAGDLPGITWRTDPEGVDVRYAAETGPSPLTGGDADAALGLTVTEGGGALQVSARLSWPSAARFPAPYRPAVVLTPADPSAAIRTAYGRAVVVASPVSFYVVPEVEAGVVARPAPLTTPTGTALIWRAPNGGDLPPGQTWRLATVTLDAGPTLTDAQRRWVGRNGTDPHPAARWGWRSGPTLGSLVSARALTDVAVSLPYLPEAPPPIIVADGRWFDRYGADTPSPGFPEGVAGAAAAVRAAGADLALRWAPLTLDASPACGTCTLDPREPSVRAGTARRAEQLFRGGVAALALSLPDAEASPESLFAALRRVAGDRRQLWLESAEAVPAEGLIDARVPPPADASAVAGACGDAITQASQDRACADALRGLTISATPPPLETPAPTAPDDLDARRRLADLWPLGATNALLGDGGLSVGAGTEAAARRRVTVSALSGGLYLLADVPATLAPERLDLYLAPLRRGLLRAPAARPVRVLAVADGAPDVWHRPGHALAVFNDTDAARAWPAAEAMAPEFAGRVMIDVFSGQRADAAEAISVPAGDVRVFVAEPPDME